MRGSADHHTIPYPYEPHFAAWYGMVCLMNPHFAAVSHVCEVSCGRALLWNALPVARRALGAPVAGKDPTPELKLWHLFSVFSLLFV